jgi:hypothetical protein
MPCRHIESRRRLLFRYRTRLNKKIIPPPSAALYKSSFRFMGPTFNFNPRVQIGAHPSSPTTAENYTRIANLDSTW